jgi:predicted DNA-binding protein
MPRNKEATSSLQVVMPKAAYEQIKALADDERRPIADMVREALEQYARAKGREVDLRVERGGDRRSAAEQ